MKETTLKSYQEEGIRIQCVRIEPPFPQQWYYQIRVNRHIKETTVHIEKAFKRMYIEIGNHLLQTTISA